MRSKAYKRYVLGTLTLVCTLNYLDRGLIGLLLQPIKEDLHLSDTQLGFLTGIAFGLFYATLGLPIARWADSGNRVTIAALAIGLWGGTVMLCLFVTNFVQLVAARIAAAVGEAGCLPTTYSLVGDYFPGVAERTRAMAIFMIASPLSSLVSFVVGGWLNERYGWRVAFFVMGLPALLIAALVKTTIAEPRTHASRARVPERILPSMADVLSTLWHQRSSRHLVFAIILLWTMGLGLGPWYAAFMMRSHGMGTAELGVWLGLISGIGGIVGTLLGGYVSARWFADDARGQMRLGAVLIAAVVPCFVAFLLLPQKKQALIALVPLHVAILFFIGPTFALMQQLVVDEMRATTLAVVLLLANLIGMGIGPQVVGILSDVFKPHLGIDSLRYAMLTMSFVALWAAYHFWQVGRTVNEDLLPRVQEDRLFRSSWCRAEDGRGPSEIGVQTQRFQAAPVLKWLKKPWW
jgi:MFS family permease